MQTRPGKETITVRMHVSNGIFLDILPKTRNIGSSATFIARHSDICRGLISSNVNENREKLYFQVSQGHFDLLAELMKFNEAAFKAFEDAVINGDRFDNFMKLAADR